MRSITVIEHASKFLLIVLCISFQAACSSKAVYTQESFAPDSPFKMKVDDEIATACEGARRSLLGQGYLIDTSTADKVKGRKAYRSDSNLSTFIEMNIDCVPESRGSTLFANGVLSTYDLKKSSSSASVGVSAVGSISLPFGQSVDSMVKISEETIDDKNFYSRFFAAVTQILGEMQPGTEPVASTTAAHALPPAAPGPAATQPPSAIAPEPGPAAMTTTRADAQATTALAAATETELASGAMTTAVAPESSQARPAPMPLPMPTDTRPPMPDTPTPGSAQAMPATATNPASGSIAPITLPEPVPTQAAPQASPAPSTAVSEPGQLETVAAAPDQRLAEVGVRYFDVLGQPASGQVFNIEANDLGPLDRGLLAAGGQQAAAELRRFLAANAQIFGAAGDYEYALVSVSEASGEEPTGGWKAGFHQLVNGIPVADSAIVIAPDGRSTQVRLNIANPADPSLVPASWLERSSLLEALRAALEKRGITFDVPLIRQETLVIAPLGAGDPRSLSYQPVYEVVYDSGNLLVRINALSGEPVSVTNRTSGAP